MRLTDTHWVHGVIPLPPLTFAFYQDQHCAGVFAAHCLELDIGGQGETAEQAIRDLQEALELYILTSFDNGQDIELRQAPQEMWSLPKKRFYPLLLRLGKRSKERKELVFAPPAPENFVGGGLQFA